MPIKKMSQATKRKISRALKRYHRCAKKHNCGKKTKRKPKRRKKKRFDPENMTVGQMVRAQGRKLKKRRKPRKPLPPGYNVLTGKLDELFWDED